MMGNCRSIEHRFESGEALLDQLRYVHGQTEWDLIRRLVEESDVRARSDGGNAAFMDSDPGPSQRRVKAR